MAKTINMPVSTTGLIICRWKDHESTANYEREREERKSQQSLISENSRNNSYTENNKI